MELGLLSSKPYLVEHSVTKSPTFRQVCNVNRAPVNLELPGLSDTVLWMVQPGSRSKSKSSFDCHIIPK